MDDCGFSDASSEVEITNYEKPFDQRTPIGLSDDSDNDHHDRHRDNSRLHSDDDDDAVVLLRNHGNKRPPASSDNDQPSSYIPAAYRSEIDDREKSSKKRLCVFSLSLSLSLSLSSSLSLHSRLSILQPPSRPQQ